MKRWSTILLASGLALVACGRESSDPRALPETGGRSAPERMAVETPGVVELASYDESGVTGTARLEPDRGMVGIEIRLLRARPGTRHLGALVRGSCEEVGERVAFLGRFLNSPSGVTKLETRIEEEVLSSPSPHSLVVYTPGSPMVACARLPAQLNELVSIPYNPLTGHMVSSFLLIRFP